MPYISGLLNFLTHICNHFLIKKNQRKKVALTLRLTLVCLQKVSFVYDRLGAGAAGAASKLLFGAGAA
jgi:hypothetical protein